MLAAPGAQQTCTDKSPSCELTPEHLCTQPWYDGPHCAEILAQGSQHEHLPCSSGEQLNWALRPWPAGDRLPVPSVQ